jgi:hypothetical protein
MLRFWYVGLLVLLASCAACGDAIFGESRSENALSRSVPCEKWSALAGDVGCALPIECEIPERCADEARAFIDCVAEDLSQCLCETHDGDLNCEGSYKGSEGPAHCIEEHRALDECLGQAGDAR